MIRTHLSLLLLASVAAAQPAPKTAPESAPQSAPALKAPAAASAITVEATAAYLKEAAAEAEKEGEARLAELLGGLEPNAPRTAYLLNEMGGILMRSDVPMAEQFFRHAAAIAHRNEDAEHRGQYTRNLAGALGHQDKNYEADKTFEAAYTILKAASGPRSEAVTLTLSNHGSFWKGLGKLKKAEALFRRALKIDEAERGLGHRSTARDLNNLGGSVEMQGRVKEAEAIYRKALSSVERALGSDHMGTLVCLSNLAGTLEQQGKYKAAVPLLERAEKIAEGQGRGGMFKSRVEQARARSMKKAP